MAGKKEREPVVVAAAVPTNYFNLPSYLLSRFAFIGTHLVFAYWLNFLLNDPFNLGTNSLDYKVIKPAATCTPIIYDHVKFDLVLFTLWWASHSIPARKVFKQTLGLWEHPLERPLFAAVATIDWGLNVVYWKPITDCSRYDPLEVSLVSWAVRAVIIGIGFVILVGFLWVLPDHVFGTAKYKYPQGKFPHSGEIFLDFPYGLVRHPAATGFLWAYWAIPAYTPNHLFLASLWTIFIIVGTQFEEGGLRGNDEFGKKYAVYKKEVAAFCPYPSSVLKVLSGKTKKI